jgi:outer membrane protein
MKKIVLIAAAALLSLAASAQEIKLAYVDFTELIQLMPEMDSARVQIEAASLEAQETYQAMVEEYQSKGQQFQQKQASWTPAIRESKAAELQQIEYRIQEFQQAIQQDLQQLNAALQAPIYEKAQKAIDDLAKANGIAVVFEKNSLLYIDPAQCVDLTPEARVALNIPEGRTLETLQAELMAKQQAAMAAQAQ